MTAMRPQQIDRRGPAQKLYGRAAETTSDSQPERATVEIGCPREIDYVDVGKDAECHD